MLEGRSWQSLKERFTRSILYRLNCFDLSEDQKQQLDPNFSEELNFDDWNVEYVGGSEALQSAQDAGKEEAALEETI